MAVTTIRAARVGPVFRSPAAPRLTEAALTAAGLPTHPYTSMRVELVRASQNGKWHVPGTGTGTQRCTHVTRRFGYQPSNLPVQKVSVLGEYDLCSGCAHQVRLPGPAGVLHVAAGLVVAAAEWVTELEELAAGMGWLDVARWSGQTENEQGGPEWWFPADVEGVALVLREKFGQLLLGCRHDRRRHDTGYVEDHLLGATGQLLRVRVGEDRPQRLVAGDHVGDRGAHRAGVDMAGQP